MSMRNPQQLRRPPEDSLSAQPAQTRRTILSNDARRNVVQTSGSVATYTSSAATRRPIPTTRGGMGSSQTQAGSLPTCVLRGPARSPSPLGGHTDSPLLLQTAGGGRFVIAETLGKGSYGNVCAGWDATTHKRVAVKVFDWHQLQSMPGGEQNLKREIGALLAVKDYPGVVHIIATAKDAGRQQTYVVMEYAGCGTIEELVQKQGRLPEEQCRVLFRCICEAVCTLHAHGIHHRDIKTANCMLHSARSAVLSDFGSATRETTASAVGSPAYQPPESAQRGILSDCAKADVWSLGLVLYEMATGKCVIPANLSVVEVLRRVADPQIEFPSDLSPGLRTTLEHMLEKDVSKRWTAKEVLESDWVAGTKTEISECGSGSSSSISSSRSVNGGGEEEMMCSAPFVYPVRRKTLFDEPESFKAVVKELLPDLVDELPAILKQLKNDWMEEEGLELSDTETDDSSRMEFSFSSSMVEDDERSTSPLEHKDSSTDGKKDNCLIM